MKKIVVAVFVAALLSVSCGPKEESPLKLRGTVLDASMDNIILLSENGDTVVVKTVVEDELPGVYVNDIVEITCKKPEGGQTDENVASEIMFLKADPAHLIDTWTQVVEDKTCGFTLNDDGTVFPINMAGFAVKGWEVDGEGNLVMTLMKRGSRIKIAYVIDKLDTDSLVLVNKDSGLRDWALSNK